MRILDNLEKEKQMAMENSSRMGRLSLSMKDSGGLTCTMAKADIKYLS